MVMGSTATRYVMRTRDCNGDGYHVRGKTWLLTTQWVVCGWSMGVGGLSGWHCDTGINMEIPNGISMETQIDNPVNRGDGWIYVFGIWICE